MEQFAILYEDEDILVANKLSPIPVQPEKSGDPSLQDLLRAEISGRKGISRPGIFLEAAHRIDRRASGAVIFAKTSKSLSTLEAAFRDHRIEKDYIACVEREPEPPSGKLTNRMVWDRSRNIVRALPPEPPVVKNSAAPADGAAAEETPRKGKKSKRRAAAPDIGILEYSLAGHSDRYFFVETRLVTGKHHQIRAQFSAAGFPIRGDLKYGARRSAPNGLIMLHARRVVFPQPRSGERLEIEAPFPASEPLWAAFSPPVEGD